MEQGLVCKRLSKRYGEGNPPALENVSFTVPANGIFAIIGRNGAGKTTLTRILATELLPTSGSAMIDGLDVVKDADEVRERIAILPQESRAIPWLTPRQSIYSYLLYRGWDRKAARTQADAALKQMGIYKHGNKLTRLMSGGTKRKTLVATVLASDAKIIFVDEPTTGLDPLSRAELWSVLTELKKDHFIFLTTHYLEEAEKLADMIGILEAGRLVAMGTMEQLREKVKYQYSVRVLDKGKTINEKTGYKVKGSDGTMQIITTQEHANKLARQMIKQKIKFAINPISLEDIFYYMVKKPINDEDESNEEEYW